MEESVVSENGDPQNIPPGVHGMATVLDAASDAEATQQPVGTDRLAVIVPVYNEERTVAELLRRLEVQPCISQIVIVDDGSTDGTWEELAPWRARAGFHTATPLSDVDPPSVIVVQHDKNQGKGRAIRTGLEHVIHNHVIIQDADLEYEPSDINKLWDVMLSGDVDVVFGSRFSAEVAIPEQHLNRQRGRRLLNCGVGLLNWTVRCLFGLPLTDEATCYKMFRTDDLRLMSLRCEGFEFCPEVTAKSARLQLTIKEVPIRFSPRLHRDGKKLRLLRDGWSALCVLWRFRNWSPPACPLTPADAKVRERFCANA